MYEIVLIIIHIIIRLCSRMVRSSHIAPHAAADLEEAAAGEGASGFACGGDDDGGAEGQLESRLTQFEGVPSWEGCGGRGRWIGLRWDPPGVGGEKVKISHFK
jgi:hypothetical protein